MLGGCAFTGANVFAGEIETDFPFRIMISAGTVYPAMGIVLGQTLYCNSSGGWNEPELLGVGERLNSVDRDRIVEGVVILFKLQ
jgi:hypothetical protein